jgi:polysaccharide export outer membrane protein
MKFHVKKIMALALLAAFLFLPAIGNASDYVIGEGDTLQISVWGVKQLDFAAKVRPDGMITVPGIGDVRASGLKPRDLQAVLAEKLKAIVRNPIVTVTVTDITNSKAYIFGNGVKPGVYELTRRTTLLQILCSLGDVNSADLKRAYVLRNGKKVKEGFYDLFVKGDMTKDIEIEANDAIFIPAWRDTYVYVLGAVTQPKAIVYHEGMTIMQAILEAGGYTKFASLNDTVVDRKEQGKDVVIPVKVKKLIKDADLSQNIKLLPGDYVIIREGFF